MRILVSVLLAFLRKTSSTDQLDVKITDSLQKNVVKRNVFVNLTSISEDQILLAELDSNRYRRNVHPAATNMNALFYNKELEKSAARHARKCIYANSDPTERRSQDFSDVGENIFITSSTDYLKSFPIVSAAISRWAQEKNDYDFINGACASQCQNYLQLVHDKTSDFGCAVATCENVRVPSTILFGPIYRKATIVICHYAPAFNNINPPYLAGESCERCQAHHECQTKLCVPSGIKLPVDKRETNVFFQAASTASKKVKSFLWVYGMLVSGLVTFCQTL